MGTRAIPKKKPKTAYEEIWEILRENAEQQKIVKQMMEENAEQQKITERKIKETSEQMKRTDERMGFLSNRFGELAEHLVAPKIHERFNELGYHFTERADNGWIIYGEDGKTKAEIDLLLQNGDTVMAVEVKTKPKVKHIEEHIKRLEILRDNRKKLNDQKHVEGAIAGAIFGIEEKKATVEAGLYVIEQSGDTMMISVPVSFKPRRW